MRPGIEDTKLTTELMPLDTPLRMLFHALFSVLVTAFHADDQID